MSVTWRKLGKVYSASGSSSWAYSHAYCPTPWLSGENDRIRVFCAFLDRDKVGRCGWVDVDAKNPLHVLGVSERPALDVGVAGAFDEHGVTPLSVVELPDGKLRLYYAGWQRGVGVRYFLFVGVAESQNGGTSFTRASEVPVLDRSDGELCFRTGCFVQRDSGTWHMWYAAGSDWYLAGSTALPRYDLRYVSSPDGLEWPHQGEVCLVPLASELGFGRPYVLREGDWYRMWYSRRALSGSYQLGYAESRDGLAWQRRDADAGIDLGEPGTWDSEMLGLSSIVVTPNATYLLYNGNGYGATGFGIALAEGS